MQTRLPALHACNCMHSLAWPCGLSCKKDRINVLQYDKQVYLKVMQNPGFRSLASFTCSECRWQTLNWKEQLWHRAVSLQQHGFLVFLSTWNSMKLPYILAYKSQNLRQNLDLKVRGATYTRVIKYRIFVQPPKYAVADEPVTAALLRCWQSKLLDGRLCTDTWQRPCVTSHGDGSRDGTTPVCPLMHLIRPTRYGDNDCLTCHHW